MTSLVKLSCKPFITKLKIQRDSGESDTSFALKVQQLAQKDGHGCIVQNWDRCKNNCQDNQGSPTGTTSCYNCLSNSNTCQSSLTNQTQACCPYVAEATQCSDCLNKNGDDITKCMKTPQVKKVVNVQSHTLVYVLASAAAFVLFIGMWYGFHKGELTRMSQKASRAFGAPKKTQVRFNLRQNGIRFI